jgi:hypothetical protein
MTYALEPSGHPYRPEQRRAEPAAIQDAPLLVDDVKQDLAGFAMTRCVYFTVEYAAAEPAADLVSAMAVPATVVLTGLSGVIVGDVKGRALLSAGDIELLFQSVEDADGWLIENPAVWLPNELVMGACAEATYGSVLRARLELLAWAIAFSEGRLDHGDYLARIAASKITLLRASRAESLAFGEWGRGELEIARGNYAERLSQKRDVLPWRTSEGQLMLGDEPWEIS